MTALTNTLRKLGFQADVPQGSFYLYVGIPKGTADGMKFDSAEEFSQWLIADKLISTVPWDDAGHFVRFSATFEASDVEEEAKVLQEVERRLATSKFLF